MLVKDFINLGGKAISRRYDYSLLNILSSVYPEHNSIWLPWRFQKVTLKSSECKTFIESVAQELNVREKRDWCYIKEEVN